jgi:hypothetical protein
LSQASYTNRLVEKLDLLERMTKVLMRDALPLRVDLYGLIREIDNIRVRIRMAEGMQTLHCIGDRDREEAPTWPSGSA